MAYDEEHRTIVRLEIESAIRRYLVSDNADAEMKGDGGEHEAPQRSFSTNGGLMAIGCGCLLVRPGKPSQSREGDSSPPTSSRDDVENTTDNTTPSLSDVVSPSEATIEGGGEPAGQMLATAGNAHDRTNPPARSSSLSEKSSTSGKVSGEDSCTEIGAEASVPNSFAADDGGVTKNEDRTPTQHEIEDAARHSENKSDIVETAERTTNATAEVEGSLEPSTPRDNADDTATQSRDLQNGQAGPTDADGKNEMTVTAWDRNSTIGSNDEISAELSRNSVLNALLSDLTRAADAWVSASAARLTGIGAHREKSKTEAPGCTAIVFLDAPLITHDLDDPRPRFLRKKSQTQSAELRRESLFQAHRVPRESAQSEPTVTLSDDGAAPSPGSRSSDVDSAVTAEPANSDGPRENIDEQPGNGDGCDDHAVDLTEQHPAGLGNPREALESLLAWIEEGDSSGCGRREVLLVCCPGGKSPLFGEKKRKEALGGDPDDTSTTAREGRMSSRGHSGDVIRQSPAASRAENSDGENTGGRNTEEAVVRAKDVDVILRDDGGPEEAAADGSEGHSSGVRDKERGDRSPGTIRQIVLGETLPIQIFPEEHTQKPGGEGKSNPHQVDRDDERQIETTKIPSVIAGMRKKKNGGSDNSTGPKSPTQPAPPIVLVPPSEVLLQTRPAVPTGVGLSRLAVTFPPPTGPPAEFSPNTDTEKDASLPTLQNRFADFCSNTTLEECVRVVVGPVIGRVGPTSGTVLVEVDSVAAGATRREEAAEVRVSDGVGVRLTDTLTGRTHHMTGGAWTGGQPGKGPRVFEFEGLAPGRRYVLRLSGVRQQDQASPRPGQDSVQVFSTNPVVDRNGRRAFFTKSRFR